MNNCKSTEIWSPCVDLKEFANSNYAVMVLNTPINVICSPLVIKQLWVQAKVRITVDGGTERWLQWVRNHDDILGIELFPDLITGDMDSLPENILNYYTSKNELSKVIVTPDQDETDFFKGLRELSAYCSDSNVEIDTIFVVVDSCGRTDQILANINTLFRSADILNNVRIFLLGSESLTWLLPKGDHVIHIPSCLRENQEWCALLPIGSPCNVTTTGLKWNLHKQKLSFGGIISSSNTYDGSPSVYVETDNPLIWSMSIASFLK